MAQGQVLSVGVSATKEVACVRFLSPAHPLLQLVRSALSPHVSWAPRCVSGLCTRSSAWFSARLFFVFFSSPASRVSCLSSKSSPPHPWSSHCITCLRFLLTSLLLTAWPMARVSVPLLRCDFFLFFFFKISLLNFFFQLEYS